MESEVSQSGTSRLALGANNHRLIILGEERNKV